MSGLANWGRELIEPYQKIKHFFMQAEQISTEYIDIFWFVARVQK